MVETTLRRATLADLVDLLREQADVKYDVVVSADRVRSDAGDLVIADGASVITADGVTTTDAVLTPTDVCDEGVADRLGIPIRYLRRMADEGKVGLLDENVNAWLDHDPSRRFLVRGFRSPENPRGVARAFLSDRYRPIDHLDGVVALLDGIHQAGAEVEVRAADLTERRMSLRLIAPSVSVMAPALLGNYRSPFTGESGADLPVVSAGLRFDNSETGGGAFSISPFVEVRVCRNGMTIKKDALRNVHLGARMDDGIVNWSTETLTANVELIRAQTRDAVTSFLNADYLAAKVAEWEGAAAVSLAAGSVTEVVSNVGRKFGFSTDEQDTILSHFISAGDVSAGGVMQAITSTALVVDDPDRATALEDAALDALAFVAAGSR